MLSLYSFLCLVSNLKRAQISPLYTCLPGFTPENHHKLFWLLAESWGCQPGEMGSARAGDQGWEPSSAVQAAQSQGKVSSSVWKSLIGTQNKNPSEGCLECIVIKINSFLILFKRGKKSLLFPWPAHFIRMLPLNRFCGCNSQDISAVALLVSVTHFDMHN